MRKILMGLAITICSSVVFAQTNDQSTMSSEPQDNNTNSVQPAPLQPTTMESAPQDSNANQMQPAGVESAPSGTMTITDVKPVLPQSDDSSSAECDRIANACLTAGYNDSNAGKKFWHDCMRALLINQTVDGVTVSNTDVAACRDFKITKLQQELQDLQNAKTPVNQ